MAELDELVARGASQSEIDAEFARWLKALMSILALGGLLLRSIPLLDFWIDYWRLFPEKFRYRLSQ